MVDFGPMRRSPRVSVLDAALLRLRRKPEIFEKRPRLPTPGSPHSYKADTHGNGGQVRRCQSQAWGVSPQQHNRQFSIFNGSRLIPQDLRPLNLKLFVLPSNSDFTRPSPFSSPHCPAENVLRSVWQERKVRLIGEQAGAHT